MPRCTRVVRCSHCGTPSPPLTRAWLAQNAYELSTEFKEGVRETKVSHCTPSVRLGIWINLNLKSGRCAWRAVRLGDAAVDAQAVVFRGWVSLGRYAEALESASCSLVCGVL